MYHLLRYLFWLTARLILPLRYRIRVQGKDELRDLRGPVLVLPNHPAYIDPIIVFTMFWPWLKMRPMVFTGNFDNWLFRFVQRLMNAHDIPEMASASSQARNQAEATISAVIAAMQKGENHIIWPSGHVQRDGREDLKAARAASDILSAVPEATVLLVRTRGLCGSKFSWAFRVKPELLGTMLRGAMQLLANLIFFMPRRRVEITLKKVEPAELPPRERDSLNAWLEQWYNEPGREAPVFVPYHFIFGPRTFDYPPPPDGRQLELHRVAPEVRSTICQMLSEKLERPLTPDTLDPQLALDRLGLDSLDRMELALDVERQFGFSSEEAPTTVGELYLLGAGLVEKAPPRPAPPEWFREPSDLETRLLGDTIPGAFVNRALASRPDVAVADDLSGALTYERLLVGALIMARRFARLPGDNVGLLLPASVGSDLAFLGLHLAGKLPIVLNWTTGPLHLAHAAQVMKLQHVITSRAFIDRTGITIAGTEFVFLEQVKKTVGTLEKLRTLLLVKWYPGAIRRSVPAISPERPAVVLFTSGSEKSPKAVPLTHGNLLSNQRVGLPVMRLTRRDVYLGFLPPFHSFGLNVTGLLPLLSGVKVVRHPDPTDATNLARKIGAYKVTHLIGTPTFLAHILERARPGELASLRELIVGAEKCPDSLVDLAARVVPGVPVLEGYGVTECSPVVAVNPPGFPPRRGSIGKPYPGIDVRLVDVDTGQPLPCRRMGMIQVAGPTVFPGYMDYTGPSPFVEEEGKRWYVTGDLAEMDEDGYIWFRGRLKRFLKAAGEMISLPALEEPFVNKFPPTEDGPCVAVEGIELEGGGRRIVLFTTQPLTLRDANALLVEKGLHGVMRLDEVRQVDSIPTLGTGKTDYKVLRAQIQQVASRSETVPS